MSSAKNETMIRVKKNYFLAAFYPLALSSILLSCSGVKDPAATISDPTFTCSSTAVAKGSRSFGMDILDQYTGGSYAADLAALKSMKGSYQTLHLAWSSIEAPGSGSTSGTFSDPFNALQTFSGIAISDGIKLSLTIRPIDATGKTVPSDLASTRFNTANMKTRFKAALDYVITRIPAANLTSIMIGNEIDNYNPTTDINFWTDYGDFLNDVRTYANATYPGLPIGFTTTFEGATNSTKTLALGWNSVAVMQSYAGFVDAVGVTYYPLTTAFKAQNPSVVSGDFTALVAFTAKPIFIQEIGYPTGAANDSSDYNQSFFYCEVFKAWDTHATRIPKMALLRMNDVTRTQADAMAGPYGVSAEAFIEYLRTLGIQSNTGAKKNGYSIVEGELVKRNF